MKSMYRGVILFIVMTIISGILYPLGVTAIGQLFFRHKSNGSLIEKDDTIIGSELIAQNFLKPAYFWPRPSASNFVAIPSMASNLGPTSAKLALDIKNRRAFLGYTNEVHPQDVPMDLLTTSASGLDPHISVEAAHMQLSRIVKARGLDEKKKAKIINLIETHAIGSMFRSSHKKIINIVLLNLNLDRCCGHD